MIIGAVMFLGGFFTALLAFYGRNAPLFVLAVVLFSFCWVGNERVHKAFRLLPIVITFVSGVLNWKNACFYLWTNSFCGYVSLLYLLMTSILIVSLIPERKRKTQVKEVAQAATSFYVS